MKPFLDRFCARNAGCQWLLAGAGAEDGELPLGLPGDLVGSSFLPASGADPVCIPQRVVPVVAIDSLVKRGTIAIPDVVKVDVQGYELEVLRGARCLFGHTAAFILETSLFEFLSGQPLLHDVVSFMAERGYVLYDIPHTSRRPFDGSLAQADLCFVRKDGPLRSSNRWA
jgi:FkbM family methyltransferase